MRDGHVLDGWSWRHHAESRHASAHGPTEHWGPKPLVAFKKHPLGLPVRGGLLAPTSWPPSKHIINDSRWL